MKIYILVIISIMSSVLAQFLFKVGVKNMRFMAEDTKLLNLTNFIIVLTDKWVVIGFLLYGMGALLWLRVLSEWEVSKAYPMVGLGFLIVTMIGWLTGENITILRALGILLIFIGVYLVAKN